MAYSPRFKALEKRASALRKQFLPSNFSSSGSYSDAQLDNARAYRLLIHAEIEHFFEDRVLEIANAAFSLWQTKNKASLPIMCLLTNPCEMQMALPKKTGTGTTALSLGGKILAKFKHEVGNNNGIRIGNLLSLLLPVGIQESEIDSAWLSTTDGFGTNRGKAAHSAHISYQIDPKDDFNTVNQIIDGIKDVDALLNKLRRTLR